MWQCMIFSLSLTTGADGEIVRLVSGQEIQGTIESFDEARGITMRRFDNGGKIDLLWAHIIKDDVKRIRESNGFYEDDAQPVMVDAVRITFPGNREEIGVIVERTADAIVLKQASGQRPFPKNRVQRVEPVKVDALKVYTSDELYQKRISESPPSNAQENYYTGVFCESILRFDLALEHYKATAAADASFKPKEVQQKIALSSYKVEQHGQTDRLDEIKQLIFKRSFKRAFERCKDFETDFASSPLKPELEKIRKRAQDEHRKYLTSMVGREFLGLLDKETDEIVANRELTLKQALTAMRDQVAPKVFAQLAKNYGVDVELVKSIFPGRNKGNLRTASYGGGTFVLRETALDGMEKKKPGEEAKPGAPAAKTDDTSLADRIKKIIEQREKEEKNKAKKKKDRSVGVGAVVDVPPKDVDWWLQAPTAERHSFLLAFFAEKAKDNPLEVVNVFPRDCSMCHREGGLPVIDKTQGEIMVPCRAARRCASIASCRSDERDDA
ncbi:MAG: hypothetical protein U1E76_24940 [Planctomycetota bacterium]